MALTLDDKPWWVGLLVGLGLAGGAIAGVEYMLVKDIKTEIRGAEAQIAELDRKIEQGRSAERKLPQFREEVRRLELELEKLRRILPSQRNTEEIIKKMKSLVDQGDFTLRRLTFPALAPKGSDPYAEWAISVSVDGRYHDLAILFNRLGNFSRIVNIESVTITALGSQEHQTIATDFVAKTFVYIESEEEKEKDKETAAKPGGA